MSQLSLYTVFIHFKRNTTLTIELLDGTWNEWWSNIYGIYNIQNIKIWFYLCSSSTNQMTKLYDVLVLCYIYTTDFIGLIDFESESKKWNWRRSLSYVQLFATPWTVTLPAPLSLEFSRPEYWPEKLFPSPRNVPYPGIEPKSPPLQADSLLTEPPGKPSVFWL